ncbi:uncharacterized protein LOC144008092 isoform X3 [Festucalex cinctus]
MPTLILCFRRVGNGDSCKQHDAVDDVVNLREALPVHFIAKKKNSSVSYKVQYIAVLRDSASRLLRLLLLVELLRPSRCGPAHRKPAAFCDALKLAASQLDVIRKTAQRLRRDDDDDDDLLEAPLESLPILATSAAQLRTWKADESLRRLHANALAFGAHAHWLKASAEKVGVPSEAAGGAHVHLLRLVDLLRTALVQMEALYLPPSPPSPSFPTVRTAFEAVRYSAETSRRLAVFCGFSKRILRRLRKAPTCPRRGR